MLNMLNPPPPFPNGINQKSQDNREQDHNLWSGEPSEAITLGANVEVFFQDGAKNQTQDQRRPGISVAKHQKPKKAGPEE